MELKGNSPIFSSGQKWSWLTKGDEVFLVSENESIYIPLGTLGKVGQSFLLRSDNGLVFTSRSYTALVKSYGLQQEFITPYTPQQNGLVERLIRTLKEQCVHRHRFETLQHASRVIGDWINFYNQKRPHQALGMKTPAEAYALAG